MKVKRDQAQTLKAELESGLEKWRAQASFSTPEVGDTQLSYVMKTRLNAVGGISCLPLVLYGTRVPHNRTFPFMEANYSYVIRNELDVWMPKLVLYGIRDLGPVISRSSEPMRAQPVLIWTNGSGED